MRCRFALIANLAIGASAAVIVAGALIGSGWQGQAGAAPTTAPHHTSSTVARTTPTTQKTVPTTQPATTVTTSPLRTYQTYPYVTRPTIPTTSTSTTSTTIAPINGRLPVVPSTLPLTTKSTSAHVSPVFAALSGAGFFVALVIMGVQWIRTRPRKA